MSQDTSWQEAFRSAIKSSTELRTFLEDNSIEDSHFPVSIPTTFAKKIKDQGPESALWKQFVPTKLENDDSGSLDPIGDVKHSKGSGIIHRYKSRLLFTPTTVCPVLCRYCFRKNELSTNDPIFKKNLSALSNYLKSHPEVNEVILTGGDPLILNETKLQEISNILIKNGIKFLRFHTRTPIILPQRINNELIKYLNKISKQFIKVIFVLHTNHISEIDHEVEQALLKLKQCYIDKKVQSVLLKNVNDSTESLCQLYYKLLECDFTPYYLHHPDKVKGAMHYTLTLEEGRRIYLKLRDQLPGWAIPHYIIDHPQGFGKQNAFNPESIHFSGQLLDKNGLLQQY